MYNHRGDDYDCPFCRIVAAGEVEGNYSKQSDVFYRNDFVTAFISAHWFPNNTGHALVVPNQHIENLYDLPFETGAYILQAARKIALAFKHVYGCDGTSIRQHNEPSGYQDVFHFHMHVFPRYKNDYLYELSSRKRATTPEERLTYAEKLRDYFTQTRGV
jgi:histidine triad (HIT) family protein